MHPDTVILEIREYIYSIDTVREEPSLIAPGVEKLTIKLNPEEYIKNLETITIIKLRTKAVYFLFGLYGLISVGTIVIIFFQGFHGPHGFQLDAKFLHWLGGATIAEVASLAVIVYKYLFTKSA